MRRHFLVTAILCLAVAFAFAGNCEADNLPIEPFSQTLTGNNGGNGIDAWTYTFSVPDQKLLVVETISVALTTMDKAEIVYVELRYYRDRSGKKLQRVYIPVIHQATWRGNDPWDLESYVGTQSVRLYVRPGTFQIAFKRNKKINWAWATASVSGYLIPLTQVIFSP